MFQCVLLIILHRVSQLRQVCVLLVLQFNKFSINDLATNPLYNVTWTRLTNTTLQFTCETACRTPSITGCNVNLDSDSSNSSGLLSNMSSTVIGSDEAISSRLVIVIVDDIDPTVDYTFTALLFAIVNRTSIGLNSRSFKGIIPATIQGTYNIYLICISVCMCVYIYIYIYIYTYTIYMFIIKYGST